MSRRRGEKCFAPEQPLHVVALACPDSGILKQLEYIKDKLEFTEIPYRFDFAANADYENFTGVLRTKSRMIFCTLKI
ncbi:MAG: hypothetical protein LBJ00_13135 [Planctomycetaceae bacterium]|jgi:hypothetical protein|nr:hypothetical protein [Planctomycetaceae bacterium]